MPLIDYYPQILGAIAVWREGRGQSAEARRGIWWVLQNRIGNPLFRPSLVRVILQPWQFSSFNANDPNVTKFPNEAVAMDWQAWLEILEMVENPGTDNTGGSCYYESFPIEQLAEVRAKSPWFAEDKLACQIDQVRFYRP